MSDGTPNPAGTYNCGKPCALCERVDPVQTGARLSKLPESAKTMSVKLVMRVWHCPC